MCLAGAGSRQVAAHPVRCRQKQCTAVGAGPLHVLTYIGTMQDVVDAARTLDKAMGLNIAVCEPFYQAIIRKLWAEKTAPTS